jgi:hypothetical protein
MLQQQKTRLVSLINTQAKQPTIQTGWGRGGGGAQACLQRMQDRRLGVGRSHTANDSLAGHAHVFERLQDGGIGHAGQHDIAGRPIGWLVVCRGGGKQQSKTKT